MEDMTMRAIRILREADLVLAEDTRTSGILLKHFDIKNRLMSHHKFNEHGTAAGVIERLKGGQTVALISDAGTPGISDPGFYLSRELREQAFLSSLCPAPPPAFLPSSLPDCPATASVSRVFFPKRKAARPFFCSWRKSNAP